MENLYMDDLKKTIEMQEDLIKEKDNLIEALKRTVDLLSADLIFYKE